VFSIFPSGFTSSVCWTFKMEDRDSDSDLSCHGFKREDRANDLNFVVVAESE
jgi:hypothetical protein